MGALHALVGFLGALTNVDADGRIILDPPAATAKFVLLNAAAHFRKVRLLGDCLHTSVLEGKGRLERRPGRAGGEWKEIQIGGAARLLPALNLWGLAATSTGSCVGFSLAQNMQGWPCGYLLHHNSQASRLSHAEHGCFQVQVTAQAHALILASGTLAPVSALTTQLFPDMVPKSIGRFACGHVVPREQLLALALGNEGSSLSPAVPQSTVWMPALKLVWA
jgi:hypothetical protein